MLLLLRCFPCFVLLLLRRNWQFKCTLSPVPCSCLFKVSFKLCLCTCHNFWPNICLVFRVDFVAAVCICPIGHCTLSARPGLLLPFPPFSLSLSQHNCRYFVAVAVTWQYHRVVWFHCHSFIPAFLFTPFAMWYRDYSVGNVDGVCQQCCRFRNLITLYGHFVYCLAFKWKTNLFD